MIILFENACVKVFVKNQIIHWVPMGSVDYECWKESFKAGFHYLKKHYKNGNIGWLNDLTDIRPPGGKHLHFLYRYVNAKAFKFWPPVKVAFVEPLNPYAKISMRTYTAPTFFFSHKIKIQVFGTKEEAINWLNEPIELSWKDKLFISCKALIQPG